MGNYYTLADARADGLTEEEATDDQVNDEISLSEELLEKWTGREFYQRTLTLNLDGTGSEWLDLTRYAPIISIDTLVIDDASIDIDTYIKIYYEGSYLRITRVGASIYSGNTAGYYIFSRGSQNVVVTGSFGHETIPAVIKRIIKLMVFRQFREEDKVGNYESEHIANYSYKLNNSRGSSGGKGDIFTGDPEIDKMISSYKYKLSFKSINRGSI